MRERVQKGAAAPARSAGKAPQRQALRQVGAPRWSAAGLDGRWEQEADRVAAGIGTASDARSTPLPIAAAPRAVGGGAAMPPSLGHTLAQGGAPMQPALRLDMEQRFGHDFSDVRLHTGAAAERSAGDLNAHAYTAGPHVVFAAGRFAPDSGEGRRLLAHELTHVVQQQAGGAAAVMRQAAGPEQSWYQRTKWEFYHAMIAAFKMGKNASMRAMRSQLSLVPPSLQAAVGSVIDVLDFVADMVIALILVLIGMAVGFSEGIAKLIYGLIQLLAGLIKMIGHWFLSLMGKPDAYLKDVNELVKAISGIPTGLKQAIDNWIVRYNNAPLEDQVLIAGELIGEIEAFIVTFAVAGTKAGQATTLTVKGGGSAAAVTKGGALALQEAPALVVTIPAVVPKTLAEGAVVATQMAALGGGGGGSGIPPASGAGSGSGQPKKPANEPKPEKMKVKEPEVPEDTHGLRDKPGGAPVREGSEVGNFVHHRAKNYERLPEFMPERPNVISDRIPPDAIAEYPVRRQGYKPGLEPRIDRLDRANHTVIEIKPKGLEKEGLAEAKTYAQDMDILEPLPNGARWQAKCVTYDYEAVMAYLRRIGYLK